jgi:N,N'-diacetyllegionaminate synthase
MKNRKIIIIAEAGVNHNGDIRKAKKLINIAKQSGADFVKFQSFKSKSLVTKSAKKTKYQIDNTQNKKDIYQLAMLKKLEFDKKKFINLLNYSKKLKIGFLLSPFDLQSVDLIKNLNLKHIKIPSGEITNFPLLHKISKNKFKIFLSTGMCNMREINIAVKVLISSGVNKKSDIVLLHCNTEYPTPYKDVNLNVLSSFKKNNFKIGYSDHTLGDHVSIAAVAMGSEVIEKHITINKDDDGPDHKASMNPQEFSIFVKKIREIEVSLGSSIKRVSRSEIKNLSKVRKSIYASRNIKKGEKFSYLNLCCKRPYVKISPMQITQYIGKKSPKDYTIDDLID